MRRQEFVREFQRRYGERYYLKGWFNNIDGVLRLLKDNGEAKPGQWTSWVDSSILHGFERGMAIREGKGGGDQGNPGAVKWARFFDYSRDHRRDSDEKRRLWSEAEQAATQHGDLYGIRHGAIPDPSDIVVAGGAELYRWGMRHQGTVRTAAWVAGHRLCGPKCAELGGEAAQDFLSPSGSAPCTTWARGARPRDDRGGDPLPRPLEDGRRRVPDRPVWCRGGRSLRQVGVGAPVTMTIRAVLGGLLAVAVTACSGIGIGAGGQEPPPGQHVEAPEGDLTGAAWLPDGRIYFGLSIGLEGLQIWSVRPQGGDARRLRLPVAGGCRRTEYLLPHQLPDGRLGLARECQVEDSLKDHTELVAVDPASGEVEPLAGLGRINPASVTWRDGLRQGFVAYFSDFCGSVAAVTRAGLQRSAGPTTLDGHTWQLDQDFFEPADVDCTPRGRADLPALTADGKRLLFLASPESAGVGGWRRLDIPWNLYLRDLPDGQPRAVARGFVKPTGIAVAPDDRGVVVGGRRGGERGLWWVDLASGAVRPIAKGNLFDPSFSPDGRRLVAVLRHDADHSELRLLDIPTGGS